MDAYVRGGQVVRLKLYPDEEISQRTEEFCFRKGELLLVVVEDAGASSKGRDGGRAGKTYYFHIGELLNEENETGESQITERAADSVRLLQEASEYLAIASG